MQVRNRSSTVESILVMFLTFFLCLFVDDTPGAIDDTDDPMAFTGQAPDRTRSGDERLQELVVKIAHDNPAWNVKDVRDEAWKQLFAEQVQQVDRQTKRAAAQKKMAAERQATHNKCKV